MKHALSGLAVALALAAPAAFANDIQYYETVQGTDFTEATRDRWDRACAGRMPPTLPS